MTKKERFEALKAMVADNEEMVNFLNREIELLSRKRTSVNSKAKLESEARAEAVYNALAEIGEPVTVSELMRVTSNETVQTFTSQRITALIRKLIEVGRVTKTADKKVSRFAVA